MMILPLKAFNLVVKLGCVILTPAHVEDSIVLSMFIHQELSNLERIYINI